MPFLSDATAVARFLGRITNMHPRLNDDLILKPWDVLEGLGDFFDSDNDGNPDGFRLGQPDVADGRYVYVGLTAETCTRQLHRPLPYGQPTHVVDYELAVGPRPPDESTPLLANLPRPDAPILRAIPDTTPGYPAATWASPMFYGWCYVDDFGNLTRLSPLVAFTLEQGQSIRAALPASLPKGIHRVALVLSKPGTSRPERPGPMHVQTIIDTRYYHKDTYDLKGPYRSDTTLVVDRNGTKLPSATAPTIFRDVSKPVAARVARFIARVAWTDANGETVAYHSSAQIDVLPDSRYVVYDIERDDKGNITKKTVSLNAGYGRVAVRRPANVPKGATGWRVYLYMQPITPKPGFGAGWRRVEDRYNELGGETPFPLSRQVVKTAGWSGDEERYGNNDPVVCVDVQTLPTENTTGIPKPEDGPEKPQPIGSSRPDADRLYVKITDVANGIESLPSPAVSAQLGSTDLLSILFPDVHNEVPNPTWLETDPNGNPLNWTLDKTNLSTKVVDGSLVMATTGAVTAATGSATTVEMAVDPTKPAYVEGDLEIAPPAQGGAVAGSAELVVRQLDAAGATISDDVVASRSAIGQHPLKNTIQASTAASGLRFNAAARKVRFFWRFSGATKNMTAIMRRTHMRRHRHAPRPPKFPPPFHVPRPRPTDPPDVPATPDPNAPSPVIPQPPNDAPTKANVVDPPEPPWTPETSPVPFPDRPLTQGTVEETLEFETGLPAGWAQNTAGGSTIAATASAALSGAVGVQFKKAAGAIGHAFLAKVFASTTPHARHAAGEFAKNRLSLTTDPTTGGYVDFHALCRQSDGRALAYLRASNLSEILDLTIDDEPTAGGSVKLNLADAASQTVAVTSTPMITDLTVGAPANPGTVEIGLDGKRYLVNVGGRPQRFVWAVTSLPTTSGTITLTVNGVTRSLRVTAYNRSKTADIAKAIAALGWSGYTVTVDGSSVQFVANLPGTRPAPQVLAGTTAISITTSGLDNGSTETAAELAARIRATAFEGYTASQGASATVVRLTGATGGTRPAPTFSPGTSGATGTYAQVQPGSIDTAEQLAARIRATAFAGWTLSGSGRTVRFTATSPGLRQRSTYSENGTGAEGSLATFRQGTALSVEAHAKAADGTVKTKKILDGIASTTIFNTDVTVSGAGTTRGVVTFWGSYDAEPLKHLFRVENVDLVGLDPKLVRLGVVVDSHATNAYELHCDAVSVTDRGKAWFRDHNALGQWLHQVEAYYHPLQPVSQDLLLQDGYARVLPGWTYTLSAYIRADVVDGAPPARVLMVHAHEAGDEVIAHPIGDVTNSPGLTGVTGWTEHKLTFTVPSDCYLISLSSRDIAGGQFVIQEAVCSPGTAPNRSYLYETAGSYATTYDVRTPDSQPNVEFWTRKRLRLGAVVDASATGTSATVTYRSADPSPTDPKAPGAYSAASSDPDAVPDRSFVETTFSASGPGTSTSVIRAGSPYVEWTLMSKANKRLSTLLLPDRSELSGGTAFRMLKEWIKRRPAGRRFLPSGVLHDEPDVFDEVGFVPGFVLLVFNDETMRRLEENWKDEYVIEAHGRDVLSVKLSEPPVFERETVTVEEDGRGRRIAIWAASVPYAEVTRHTGQAL